MARKAVILATTGDVSEMQALVSSLGYEITAVEQQGRTAPDPRSFLGKGRVKELADRLEQRQVEADVVIVAGDLRPSQVLQLERVLKRPVFDRVRLILEIFRDRASSEAAKLQVELAQLHYELPVLREAIHRAKTGERPGFLAGGATAFATQVEPVRTRMAQVRRELERIRREGGVRRQNRRQQGYWQVSLAGYTNAGKSTLLNALTDASVATRDELFSTLETRTRRVTGPGGRSRLLITDTVGFIRDLPPWLVEAFHATLEEIAYADLVLLVVDGSEPVGQMNVKQLTSVEVLRTFLADQARPELAENMFLVFTKVDAAPPSRDFRVIAEQWGFGHRYAVVSASQGQGLDELVARMRAAIPTRQVLEMHLPFSDEAYQLIGRLSTLGELESVEEGHGVDVRVAVPTAKLASVRRAVRDLGGTLFEP